MPTQSNSAPVQVSADAAVGRSGPARVWPVGFAFLLSLAAGLACYFAGGVSLGLFLGPVLLLTVVTPPMGVVTQRARDFVLMWVALVAGTSAVWLFVGSLSATEWLRCTAVLAAWVAALMGIAAELQTLGTCLSNGEGDVERSLASADDGPSPLPSPLSTGEREERVSQRSAAWNSVASALTAILGVTWLTWPVWLSQALSGSTGERIAAVLSFAHPLLAINGVVVLRFDQWDRYRLAYTTLTRLNQDVLYHLPASVWPAVLLHFAIAGATFAAVRYSVRGRKGRIG